MKVATQGRDIGQAKIARWGEEKREQ